MSEKECGRVRTHWNSTNLSEYAIPEFKMVIL